MFDAHFHGMRTVQTLSYRDSHSSTSWLYTVLVEQPQDFILHMNALGVDCSQVHARNDGKSIFARWRRHLPGVDYFSARQVNIPCGFWVGEQERKRIISAVLSYETGRF
jgi:perosamine synthetase